MQTLLDLWLTKELRLRLLTTELLPRHHDCYIRILYRNHDTEQVTGNKYLVILFVCITFKIKFKSFSLLNTVCTELLVVCCRCSFGDLHLIFT